MVHTHRPAPDTSDRAGIWSRTGRPAPRREYWQRLFRGQQTELRQLRHWLTALLPDTSARDDLVSVAVELGTNAIQHTASGDGGWFTVEVACLGPVIRVAVTDEAQAMERIGIRAALVPGSPFNIKVTRAEDLKTAADILKMRESSQMRIGQGVDVHAFGEGDHVVLGGVRIAHVQGVIAHSDGDVVIHALCDALLGAMGDGDIGQHFPDSDPRYRGADSRVFLRVVAERMAAAGLRLVNADITVLAETPRINAHRAAMAANLAADLQVAVGDINIKATTTERLGFIGRKEGLAAMASVLLTR